MKLKKYLRLITKTYLEIQQELSSYEYGNGIQGSEEMSNLKKKIFIERILRNQKVSEKKHFVTKDEFERGCYLAVDTLQDYIYFQAFFEINRLADYRNDLKKNIKANSNEIKMLIKKTTKEINNFDMITYLSDLSSLESNLKGEMCQKDSKFIQWVFEDFSFEKNETKNEIEQKSETEVNYNSTESKQLADKYLGQSSNQKADALFNYLCKYYRKDEITKVKYVNILHFLKKDANKKEYIFKLTQGDYKTLIEKEQGIKILKFAKSETYYDSEIHILNRLEKTFRTEYDV